MKNYAHLLLYMMIFLPQPTHTKPQHTCYWLVEETVTQAQQNPAINALAHYLNKVHQKSEDPNPYVLPENIDATAIMHATLFTLKQNSYPIMTTLGLNTVFFPFEINLHVLATQISIICTLRHRLFDAHADGFPTADLEQEILTHYEEVMSYIPFLQQSYGTPRMMSCIETYLKFALPREKAL